MTSARDFGHPDGDDVGRGSRPPELTFRTVKVERCSASLAAEPIGSALSGQDHAPRSEPETKAASSSQARRRSRSLSHPARIGRCRWSTTRPNSPSSCCTSPSGCDRDRAGGPTKLNKVLFFADFSHAQQALGRQSRGPSTRSCSRVLRRAACSSSLSRRVIATSRWYRSGTTHRAGPSARAESHDRAMPTRVEPLRQTVAEVVGRRPMTRKRSSRSWAPGTQVDRHQLDRMLQMDTAFTEVEGGVVYVPHPARGHRVDRMGADADQALRTGSCGPILIWSAMTGG